MAVMWEARFSGPSSSSYSTFGGMAAPTTSLSCRGPVPSAPRSGSQTTHVEHDVSDKTPHSVLRQLFECEPASVRRVAPHLLTAASLAEAVLPRLNREAHMRTLLGES